MDIVGDILHTVGKLLPIADKSAVFVAAALCPAVVYDYVLVAAFLKAGARENVGRAKNELFVDFFRKGVPSVPAHGRGKLYHFFSCSFKICDLNRGFDKTLCNLHSFYRRLPQFLLFFVHFLLIVNVNLFELTRSRTIRKRIC